jgi:TPR repeat protein
MKVPILALGFVVSLTGGIAAHADEAKQIDQDILNKRLGGETKAEEVLPEAGFKKRDEQKPDLAYGAFQRGEYLTAFQLALPLAEKGDAAAQTLIAELYDKGLGIGRDTRQAATWYKIAAESGNREAQFSYALKLLQGRDLPQDKPKGEAMMKKAAEAGHPVAMFNHANQIVANRPTSAGYRQALPFYEKAAENRLADAYYALAVIYREGRTNGIQDPVKARQWLERAAKAGVDTAQIELGIALINGTDGPKDEKLAFSILKGLALRGNVIAQNRVAHMYANGIGVKASQVDAGKWHILASRAGRADLDLDQFIRGLDPKTRQKALRLANEWRGS